MENKEDISLGRLFGKLAVVLMFALVLIVGVPVGGIFLWAAITDAKHERMEPQVEELAIVYLQEQYPGHDFDITGTGHNFKDNTFDVKVQSRSSMDTHFTLKFRDDNLELETDTYEWAVEGRGNTRERIVEEYESRVKEVLEKLPGVKWVYPDFTVYSESTGASLYFSPEGLNPETLILDGTYDVSAMGDDHGYLELYFTEEAEDIHLERIAQRLLEVEQAMTEAGVGYRVVNISLCTPDKEYGSDLKVYEILREDVRSEDLLERLQRLWEEQEARRQEDQKDGIG